MAVDQSATFRQDHDLHESQERYRDLFENSSEMIATLSPAGQFLYANPAWKRCFGLDYAAMLALDSFEESLSPAAGPTWLICFAARLTASRLSALRCATTAPTARVLEFELNLSQRQKAGNPLAVRCLLRDVTQQKQREHRLALQLVVSQIVGESIFP